LELIHEIPAVYVLGVWREVDGDNPDHTRHAHAMCTEYFVIYRRDRGQKTKDFGCDFVYRERSERQGQSGTQLGKSQPELASLLLSQWARMASVPECWMCFRIAFV
jgi:hypothetical protein